MEFDRRVKLGKIRVDLRNNRATGSAKRTQTKKTGSARGQNRL